LRADWPWGQRELNKYYLRSYKTLILPVAEYGCDVWSVAWREMHRLVVFEIMALRGTFLPKRHEIKGSGEKHITRSFMTCSPHHMLFDQIKNNEMGGTCGTFGGQDWCVQDFGGEI
jgi:hypothetical protein